MKDSRLDSSNARPGLNSAPALRDCAAPHVPRAVPRTCDDAAPTSRDSRASPTPRVCDSASPRAVASAAPRGTSSRSAAPAFRASFEAAHAFTARWEGGLVDHPDDPGGVTNFGVSLRFLQAQGLAGHVCPLVPDSSPAPASGPALTPDSSPAPASGPALQSLASPTPGPELSASPAPAALPPHAPDCAACEAALSVACVPYPDVDADGDIDAEDIRRLSSELAARILRRAFWDSFPLDAVPPACAFALYDCAVNLGVGRARRLMQEALGVESDGRWGPVTWAAIRACESPERDLAAARKLCLLRREYYEALVRRSPKMIVFLDGWLARVQALLEVLRPGSA